MQLQMLPLSAVLIPNKHQPSHAHNVKPVCQSKETVTATTVLKITKYADLAKHSSCDVALCSICKQRAERIAVPQLHEENVWFTI